MFSSAGGFPAAWASSSSSVALFPAWSVSEWALHHTSSGFALTFFFSKLLVNYILNLLRIGFKSHLRSTSSALAPGLAYRAAELSDLVIQHWTAEQIFRAGVHKLILEKQTEWERAETRPDCCFLSFFIVWRMSLSRFLVETCSAVSTHLLSCQLLSKETITSEYATTSSHSNVHQIRALFNVPSITTDESLVCTRISHSSTESTLRISTVGTRASVLSESRRYWLNQDFQHLIISLAEKLRR